MTDDKIFYMSNARIGRYNPDTGEYEDIQLIPAVDSVNLISGDELAILHRDDIIPNKDIPPTYMTDAVGSVNITVTIHTARRRGHPPTNSLLQPN